MYHKHQQESDDVMAWIGLVIIIATFSILFLSLFTVWKIFI